MSFTIDFDRENRTYEPGEKVTCKVEVSFETPAQVRCIAVRFHGFAATEWTKVKSSKGRKRIKTYTGFEEYFRTYNDLNGERGGRVEMVVKKVCLITTFFCLQVQLLIFPRGDIFFPSNMFYPSVCRRRFKVSFLVGFFKESDVKVKSGKFACEKPEQGKI